MLDTVVVSLTCTGYLFFNIGKMNTKFSTCVQVSVHWAVSTERASKKLIMNLHHYGLELSQRLSNYNFKCPVIKVLITKQLALKVSSTMHFTALCNCQGQKMMQLSVLGKSPEQEVGA